MDIDLSLIRKWEGFRPDAYKCSAGRWTIGYGSTYLTTKGRKVEEGDTITVDVAEVELNAYVNDLVKTRFESLEKVYGELPTELKESLCSLAYNVGVGCLNSETFKKALEKKSILDMADWFRKWRLVGGEVNKGLVNRRRDEIRNFKRMVWL